MGPHPTSTDSGHKIKTASCLMKHSCLESFRYDLKAAMLEAATSPRVTVGSMGGSPSRGSQRVSYE